MLLSRRLPRTLAINTYGNRTTNNFYSIINKEVEKFGHIGDWNQSDDVAPLRTLNKLRIPWIVEHLGQQRQEAVGDSLKHIRLLDVGSGGGLLSEPLAKLGAQVIGIEPSRECVEYCEKRLQTCSYELKRNLSYYNGYLDDFVSDNQNQSFDGVIASELLDHVPNWESIIETSYQVLKPNGLLYITTMNRNWLSYICIVLAAERLFKIVPKGTHYYHLMVPLKELKKSLKQNGFEIKFVKGYTLNPLTLRWRWTWHKWLCYAVVAQKVVVSKIN